MMNVNMNLRLDLAGTVDAPAQTREQTAREVQQQVEQALREGREAARDAGEAARQAVREARIGAQEARDAAQAEISAAQQGIPDPPAPPQPTVYYTGQPNPWDSPIPPQVVDIISIVGLTLVFCVIGYPLARAFARWIDRRGTSTPVSTEVSARLVAIEQAVESIAVEVERISEGQRYTTRLLSERTREPVPAFGVADRDVVPIAASPANSRRS